MNHEQFQNMLDKLVKAGVGQEVFGEVLARVSLKAPQETSRIAIAAENPTARRAVDQRAIPQGTVSKAVKALMDEGLLEAGERALQTPDGRPLLPIRLGSSYAIAGVKITQSGERPRRVTTALLGLDGSRRPLDTADDQADRWDQAIELIHRHVTALKSGCDDDRAARGLKPLRMLGVGIEVGSPAYNGEVMPHRSASAGPPVALAASLNRLFEDDPSFSQPIPVIVENDVNALAVLAIHQAHYAEPDLVVIGVFDEGVGGGLIMDGRLRRGGNGRAMEIGHLAVGFPPGQQEQPPDIQEPNREAGRTQDCRDSAPAAGAATSAMSTPSHRRAAFRECSATCPWTSSARSTPPIPGSRRPSASSPAAAPPSAGHSRTSATPSIQAG